MRRLLLFIVAVLMTSIVDAQVRVNLNLNVDRQPVWGPTGYDHVEYYYLPDIEAYYNVPQRKYYYQEKGRWASGTLLPNRYRGFDLYHAYKVVVNEPTPYRNHATYKDKYASYKGRRDQQSIRDSRDSKYYVNPRHPEHMNWVKQQKHERETPKGGERDRNNQPGRK
jgi:hypothetical protein